MKYPAFSLIELMVVIAIVAILAAVAVPSYMTYAKNAKLSGSVNAVNSWVKLYQMYENKHGVFPASVCDVGLPGDCAGTPTSWVPGFMPVTVDDYAIKPYVNIVSFGTYNFSKCNLLTVAASMINFQPTTSAGLPLMNYQVLTRDKDGVWEQICMAYGQLGNTLDPDSGLHVQGCYDGSVQAGFDAYQDTSNQWFAECT